MKLISPNFEDNSIMPAVFTLDGSNKCPDFYVSDIPAEAKSIALVCHDPDATSGVPWVHWLVFNIASKTNKLLSGILPEGASSGINSFGNKGYGGPSPSPGSGPHRYIFTAYALNGVVNIDGQKSYKDILNILMPLSINHAIWTGIYERN